MDDLLALMGASDGDGDSEANGRSDANNHEDDSSITNGNAVVPRRQPSNSVAPPVPENGERASSSNIFDTTLQSTAKRHNACSTVDSLTKLRIVDRRTSRLDMADLLAPLYFFTTAGLASMSHKQLSRLVTVPSKGRNGGGFSFGAGPASSRSSGFNGGKTNAATMGVLFHNSGSKTSSGSGRAYSIFELGDLSTGPCVSIYLFGDAYSKHTGHASRIGRSGSVLAILAPNILPPRQGGDTSITLSVNNPDQIVHIGSAQDYGVCVGTKRVRRDGKFTELRCQKFVDKRLGQYCASHKSCGLQKTTMKGKQTFLQKLKADKFGTARPVVTETKTSQATNRGGFQSSSRLSEALSVAGVEHSAKGSTGYAENHFVTPHSRVQTNASPANGRKLGINAPMHMKKTALSSNVTRIKSMSGRPAPAKCCLGRNDVLGDALNSIRGGLKAKAGLVPQSRPKARKIAHMMGFDGSVPVPRPNKFLFGSSQNSTNTQSAQPSAISATPSPNEAELRERQHLIARERRNALSRGGNKKSGLDGSTGIKYKKSANSAGKVGGATEGQLSDIFAGLKDLDCAEAMSRTSKFKSQADAEQYARSRQIVNELERKERSKNSREKQKSAQKGGTGVEEKIGIMTVYICHTCQRKSSSPLLSCVRRGHKIKRRRDIKKATTCEESRDRINEKSAEEGGLQLGSGLEWSGYKNF